MESSEGPNDPPLEAAETESTGTLDAAGKAARDQEASSEILTRLLDGFSSLRTKLVLPYVILTLLLAFGGIFIVTRLVTSSVRERFVNQLYEARRVSADSVVRQEQEHLSTLRLMTFTDVVPSAINRGDGQTLNDLLWPLALNEGTQAVVVLDDQGREILGLIREPDEETYVRTSGSSFAEYEFVARVLRGEADDEGDKFIGLVDTTFGTYLFTSGPVRDANGDLIGVLLVGSRLDRVT